MRTRFNSLFKSALVAICATSSVAAWAEYGVTFRTVAGNYNKATIQIEGRGFTKAGSYDVFTAHLYLNDQERSQSRAEGGSFSFNVEASDGLVIRVSVPKIKADGGTYSKSFTYHASGSGTSPAPTQPQPQQPAPLQVSNAQIRESANQQARTVANRVANTYGELERWKYNFTNGFWAAIELSRLNSDADNSRYRDGLLDGEREGRINGNNDGITTATSAANSQARSDAASRFEKILDTLNKPDTNLDVPTDNFSGNLPNVDQSDSFLAAAKALDADLQGELGRLSWGYEGWTLNYGATNAYTLVDCWNFGGQGKYSFLDSWFRSSFAWDEWANDRLGGSYNHSVYNKGTSEQQQRFIEEFKAVYDNVIDEKFIRVKTRENITAFVRGQFYGTAVALRAANIRGFRNGYARTFQGASRNGYRNTFRTTYTTVFNNTVDRYQSSAVVRLGEARLINDYEDGAFAVGQLIGVRLDKAINAGRQKAQGIAVRIENQGSIQTTGKTGTFDLAASSTQSGLVFKGLAKIGVNTLSDKDIPVVLNVGDQKYSTTFRIDWQMVLDKFAKADPRSASFAATRRYILANLQEEWDALIGLKGKKNGKSLKDGDTKLENLVRFAQGNAANFKSLNDGKDLEKIRSSGGGFHPVLRSRFKHQIELLNKLN